MVEGGLVGGATTVSEGRRRTVFVTGGTGSVGRSLVGVCATWRQGVVSVSPIRGGRTAVDGGIRGHGHRGDLAVPGLLGNGMSTFSSIVQRSTRRAICLVMCGWRTGIGL